MYVTCLLEKVTKLLKTGREDISCCQHRERQTGVVGAGGGLGSPGNGLETCFQNLLFPVPFNPVITLLGTKGTIRTHRTPTGEKSSSGRWQPP